MLLTIVKIIVRLALIFGLPFFVLIRTSVYLHYVQGWPTSFSFAASIGLCSVLLSLYLITFYKKLSVPSSGRGYLRRRFVVLFLLVTGFLLYLIMVPPSNNAKSSEVAREYYKIHPILRLASSTIFLLDRDGIITDGSRLPEDYRKMGLPTARRSLHYIQHDGYAYAMDIRTRGRSEVRNLLVTYYFKLMGFNTLRHVGTADHLHVAMPLNSNK